MPEGLPPRTEGSPEPAPPHERPIAPPRTEGPSSVGGIFHLPLWLRWLLSSAVAAGLLVALVLFVESHNTDSTATESPAAAVEANREAEILVSQDQAPHVVRLVSRATPVEAVEHAIRAEMAGQISRGAISGPLTRITCTVTGTRAAARRPFRCTALAANVNYPFLGVLDARQRRITYCKRDAPPVPSQNVPVSRRCLA